MTQEFYRGGSRSLFQSEVETGSITFTNAGLAVLPVAAAVGTMLRLKRIQVQLHLEKTPADIHGWGAFLRVPQGFAPTYSDLNPNDPTVLRAKPVLCNADHATYWDFYLEAINIDAGGAMLFVVRLNTTLGAGSTFSIRYTSERQVG